MAPMANDNTENERKVVVVEFSVSMHCNACERKVAKAIAKCKGVEKFVTDMRKHKATVTGTINPEKVLKKLKKKTGKRVEIMVPKEEEAAGRDEDDDDDGDESAKNLTAPFMFLDCKECVVFEMFSDENANACSVM